MRLCTGTKNNGQPCTRSDVFENERCRDHGGTGMRIREKLRIKRRRDFRNEYALRTIRHGMPYIEEDDLRAKVEPIMAELENRLKGAAPAPAVATAETLTVTSAFSGGVENGRLSLRLVGDDGNTYEVLLKPMAVLEAVRELVRDAANLPPEDLDNYHTVIAEGDVTLGISQQRLTPILQLLMNGVPMALRLSDERLACFGAQLTEHLGHLETKH